MSTLYTNIDSNKRKTWLLLSGFFVFIIIVGYVFSYALDNQGILVIAVVLSIVMSFVSYWWSDKIVLAMSDARKVDRETNRELYRVVENLCITAGLPVPAIYIINDTAPNAFATGRDPEHAVVAVTEGLLMKLDRSELEGVIAHELSHVGNRDILLATLVTVLVGVVVLLADWFRRWTFWGGGRRRNNDRGGGAIAIDNFHNRHRFFHSRAGLCLSDAVRDLAQTGIPGGRGRRPPDPLPRRFGPGPGENLRRYRAAGSGQPGHRPSLYRLPL